MTGIVGAKKTGNRVRKLKRAKKVAQLHFYLSSKKLRTVAIAIRLEAITTSNKDATRFYLTQVEFESMGESLETERLWRQPRPQRKPPAPQ